MAKFVKKIKKKREEKSASEWVYVCVVSQYSKRTQIKKHHRRQTITINYLLLDKKKNIKIKNKKEEELYQKQQQLLNVLNNIQ